MILYMIISLKLLGFDQNAIGMKIHKVKRPQLFFNLEKKHCNPSEIRKLIIEKKETDEDVEILNKIKSFYETIFKSQFSKNVSEIEKELCAITTPSLNNNQINLCEKDLFL